MCLFFYKDNVYYFKVSFYDYLQFKFSCLFLTKNLTILKYLFSNFPFIRFTIALIFGILLYNLFKIDFNSGLYILPIVGFAYGLVLYFYKGISRNFLGALGMIFLILFGYYISFRADLVKDNSHFSKINNGLFYTAIIDNLVEEKPKSWKVVAQINTISTSSQKYNCNGKILLYLDKSTVEKPKYGDNILVKGMPNLVEAPKNPYEFDYKNYLANQGIYHQQYLRDTSFVKMAQSIPNRYLYFAIATNNYCDSLFTKYFAQRQELAVANAMILGLRDDIDNDLIQAYSAAGAIHVLSVSGLHVGVIYLVLVWIFGFFKKIKYGGKFIFLFLILFILWFYAAITGFSSPVLRSTFMFSLILIAETLNRNHNSYNTVAISAFCLLLYNPLFIYNVGFLLSYLAVFGMIQIQPYLNPLVVIDKYRNSLYWLADRLWKVSTVAIAAQIATLPITIYFFHQFPNYFLLANPIVILLSSIVLIGGLLFLVLAIVFNFIGLSILTTFAGAILQWFVQLLNRSVQFTEKLPGAISKYLYVSFYEMLILYFLIFCILALINSKKYIWVRLALVTLCFLIGLNIYEYRKFRVQNIICIQAIPKATVVSVFNGKKVRLFGDMNLLNDRKNISFRLNNQFAARGVTKVEKVIIPKSNFFQVWKGKSFLFLEHSLDLKTDDLNLISVDYLILTNKRIRYEKDIRGKIKFNYLILDGSYTQFYIKKFQNEAANDGVLAYSLLNDGALTL
jgi:competence protein ComEC